jgi:putative acetyltransferase
MPVLADFLIKATVSDFGEITEVWEASVRATHHFLSEEDILFFRPLILNEYLHAVDVYCIRDENKMITGFLGTSGDKLEMLFIHPASRGRGIGKALLQFAVANLHVRKVDVNEQNSQAVGFYQHFGFRIVDRSERDGMGKPYPILHMELGR